MNIYDLDKNKFSFFLKEFLREEIVLKALKPASLVEKLKGRISRGSVYRIFESDEEINFTLFTITQICFALDYSVTEFMHKFELFIYKNKDIYK